MSSNDEVIARHTLLGHPVAISCLSRPYNIQVKNVVTLKEKIR